MGKDLKLRIDSSSSSLGVDMGDVVKFHWVGYYYDNSLDIENDTDFLSSKEFSKQKDWIITIGNGEVEPALEMGLRFMKCGQIGTILGHPKYCYGSNGLVDQKKNENNVIVVPANCFVRFVVEVVNVLKPEEFNGSHDLCMEHAIAQKGIGNFYFGHAGSENRSMHLKACRIYRGAVEMVKDAKIHELVVPIEKESSECSIAKSSLSESARHLIIDCLNNSAMTYMKLKEYRLVKDICGEIIQFYDKDNLKALCRATQAAIFDGNFEEAKAALEAALEVDYNHSDVKRVERFYIKSKRELKLRQKELYSKMGSSFASKPTGHNMSTETSITYTAIKELTSEDSKQQYFSTRMIGSIALLSFSLLSYIMYCLQSPPKKIEL